VAVAKSTILGTSNYADAAPEPVTTYAPGSELITVVDVARRVGAVTRALPWRGAIIGAPTPIHREYDFPERGWLQKILAG
jgi:hypothetical protein